MVTKKGAINLSINMIIVLILAIVILGFALSFTTSMFRKAEFSLTEQFPTVDVPVNRDRPIGIGDEFLLRDKEVRRVALNVFNSGAAVTLTATSDIAVACGGADPTIENAELKSIPSGEETTLKVVIRGASGMTNNDICTMTIGGTITQSFFLNTK